MYGVYSIYIYTTHGIYSIYNIYSTFAIDVYMFTIFYCYLTWTARAAISARTVASNLRLRLASGAVKPSGGKAQAARCKFGLSGLQRVHLRARATASKRVAAKRFDEGHPAPATPMGDAPLDPVLDKKGFRVLQPNETVPQGQLPLYGLRLHRV
jgi:hypothetical protein